MSPVTVGLISFIVIFALLAVGLPIAFTMGLVGFAGFWYLTNVNAAIIKAAVISFETLSNYDLSCIPLFILMANVCFVSGLGKSIYTLADAWLGRLPGGLAVATIGGCAGFSAVSASSVATALTMGLVAIPEMKKQNYAPGLITGSIVAGGTLGPLIPPSGMFIYYGILTETSISKLFVAGVIPGLLLGILYILTVYILCVRNPKLGPRGNSTNFKQKILAFKDCIEVIGLILVIMGGLVVGWFTPTEAGSVGAFGAIVFSLLRKRLTWDTTKKAIFDTVSTTGMIYAMLIGVMIYVPFMDVSLVPIWLSNAIQTLGVSPFFVMVLVIILYIVLGIFMDEAAMMFITVPILSPMVFGLGFDPIWFGVMVVVLMMMATISPPLGMNMFVIASIAKDIPMTTIYKGVLPFMAANFVLIVILLFVPAIALFLPNLMS